MQIGEKNNKLRNSVAQFAPENLAVLHQAKKLSVFYGKQVFVTLFTTASHSSLSADR
jgi:hypothetical protein